MTVDEATWTRIASECDSATFFHTPMWERAVLASYPEYSTATFALELDSGEIAVHPLIEVSRHLNGLGKSYVSTFARCYGGPIAGSPLGPRDNARIEARLSTWNTARVDVTSNPLCRTWTVSRAFQRNSDFTHILPLNAGFPELAGRFGKDHRHAIARGRKESLTIGTSETLDTWRRYFALYEAAIERWGRTATSRYPWRLFQSLFELSAKHPRNVRLWTAEKDGDLVAGALIFYWNAHAVYWHAAINRDYAGLAPAKPLLAAAIENACSDGYGYFDFSPSGGHDSVATFKARFGAEAWPVEHYRFERAPLRAARHLRESVTSIMRRSAPSALPSSGTAHRLSAGPRPT